MHGMQEVVGSTPISSTLFFFFSFFRFPLLFPLYLWETQNPDGDSIRGFRDQRIPWPKRSMADGIRRTLGRDVPAEARKLW